MLTPDVLKNCKIMVVVAHPDDELLGPGASLHKLIQEYGVNVHVVILGEGLTSRSDTRDPERWEDELKAHRKNIEDARAEIGYHSLSVYDFPDNRFDTVPLLDLVKTVEKEKDSFVPGVILTHHGGDLNIDHRKTFEAVMTACRPMQDEPVHTIMTFETPSGTEWRASTDPKHFIPNWYLKLSKENVEAKVRAMEKYTFEKRPYPHPRSPEALKYRARNHGSVVGAEYAEAFCLVRSVQQ